MKGHVEKCRQMSLNISHYRKMRGWTQAELANAVHISKGYMGHIEAPNMTLSISLSTLFDIADALNVEPKQFFEFHPQFTISS